MVCVLGCVAFLVTSVHFLQFRNSFCMRTMAQLILKKPRWLHFLQSLSKKKGLWVFCGVLDICEIEVVGGNKRALVTSSLQSIESVANFEDLFYKYWNIYLCKCMCMCVCVCVCVCVEGEHAKQGLKTYFYWGEGVCVCLCVFVFASGENKDKPYGSLINVQCCVRPKISCYRTYFDQQFY